MATEKKLTKKASSKIYNVVIKFQPKASKLITYDEAWEVIAKEGNLEGELETKRNGVTKFILYKNDEVVHEYDLTGTFKPEIGDWDWTTIYKTVLEDVVSRRLYKNVKIKKSKKSLEKPTSIEKPISKKESPKKEEKVIDIKELRRQRDNLSVKIWDWKKKGKDVVELEKKLEQLKEELKSIKKPSKT